MESKRSKRSVILIWLPVDYPHPNTTHPVDVVKAALAMQQFMKEHKEGKIANGKTYFEIRVGVHTGPVVAGHCGGKEISIRHLGRYRSTQPAESKVQVQAGMVNISYSTYQYVKDTFSCRPRGHIKVKGKGRSGDVFCSGINLGSKIQNCPMLYLSGIIISFFLALVLVTKKHKSPADFILMVWLILIGLHLVSFYFIFSNQQLDYPVIIALGMPLPLVQGPFLYLYTYQQTSALPFNKKQLLHFLPVLMSYLLFGKFFLLTT